VIGRVAADRSAADNYRLGLSGEWFIHDLIPSRSLAGVAQNSEYLVMNSPGNQGK